jgi:hypothetical protein
MVIAVHPPYVCDVKSRSGRLPEGGDTIMGTYPDSDNTVGQSDVVITIAAASRCSVLITAAPDEALELARLIADRKQVLVWDFGKTGQFRPSSATALEHASVLLLREVHELTASQQAWLMGVLDDAARRGFQPRIIASSSQCLYGRVRERLFDDRLFYRLNAFQFVVADGEISESHPSGEASRMSPSC